MDNFTNRYKECGPRSSVMVTLCCLGVPPLAGLTIALLFAPIMDRVPLHIFFLFFIGMTVAAIYYPYRFHRRHYALILGLLGSVVMMFFTFVYFLRLAILAGLAGIIVATYWNMKLHFKLCYPRRQAKR